MVKQNFPKLDLLASNNKLDKSQKKGFWQVGLSLAPADESGRNVCPHATEGCKAACLFTAGMGRMPKVVQGRMARTLDFFKGRAEFLKRIDSDIAIAKAWGGVNGFVPVVRLNVISDLLWENFKTRGKNLFDLYPDVQFLDYTKNFKRMEKFLNGEMPKNYHLTFSRAETAKNQKECSKVLAMGGNVAIVFAPLDPKAKKRSFDLPESFEGRQVVCGDNTDLRFLDPKNVVVGLRAKGKAWHDNTGFVQWF